MRGGDTSALRAFNERLIIGAIRQHGALSKAEVARITGLSAQSASMIVNALLQDGVVIKRDKVKGQIGQPSTPIALNPEGAYAVGLKIGRRSVEAVLVDFLGGVVASAGSRYAAPLPEPTMAAARTHAACVLAQLPVTDRGRVAGLGVAMPGDLSAWADELGLQPAALAGWQTTDVPATLAEATGLDVAVWNDATAACAAEMALGDAVEHGTVLYLYLGSFVGGGLVLDGRLCRGSRGNAAAIGSMPMAEPAADGRPRQLIHEASVVFLEGRLAAAGVDPAQAMREVPADAVAEATIAAWTAQAGDALARATVAAASVIDIETVVIDGLLAAPRVARVVDAVRSALDDLNRKGLSSFAVRQGSIGPPARVLGAALLPLSSRFSPDPDLLIRGPKERVTI